MAKLHQTHHRQPVPDHLPTATATATATGDTNFNLWSSCRRKIINTMRCSGGMSLRRKTINPPTIPKCKSDSVKKDSSSKGSEKLGSDEKSARLKEVVKRLQGGGDGDVLRGAKDVRELAKADVEARTNLGSLGAIPPLVAMVDCCDLDSQISALYALLNLGIGNDLNKAAIVEAGAVHKMLDLIESGVDGSRNSDLTAAIVANFLGLSALDSNKSVIGSSGAIAFLIEALKSLIKVNTANTNSQVVQDCLRALYNLSILPANVLLMIEVNGFVPFLLTAIGGDMEISDRILSILANIVSTPEGRRAVSTARDAFTILVDVLSWMDSPDCQEKVTYILMVMAYKSNGDQQAMIEAGIMSSLLELTLLGSTLAQKRSSRILEILRNKKGKHVLKNLGGATISAPLCGSNDKTESVHSSSRFSNTNAVKHLVEQSLQKNMMKIVKRANLQQELASLAHLKPSVVSYSSSKSLPF